MGGVSNRNWNELWKNKGWISGWRMYTLKTIDQNLKPNVWIRSADALDILPSIVRREANFHALNRFLMSWSQNHYAE